MVEIARARWRFAIQQVWTTQPVQHHAVTSCEVVTDRLIPKSDCAALKEAGVKVQWYRNARQTMNPTSTRRNMARTRLNEILSQPQRWSESLRQTGVQRGISGGNADWRGRARNGSRRLRIQLLSGDGSRVGFQSCRTTGARYSSFRAAALPSIGSLRRSRCVPIMISRSAERRKSCAPQTAGTERKCAPSQSPVRMSATRSGMQSDIEMLDADAEHGYDAVVTSMVLGLQYLAATVAQTRNYRRAADEPSRETRAARGSSAAPAIICRSAQFRRLRPSLANKGPCLESRRSAC